MASGHIRLICILLSHPLASASPGSVGTFSPCFQKEELLYNCEPHRDTYENICCTPGQPFAEYRGFLRAANFFYDLEQLYGIPNEVVFFDSSCGIPIYVAPRGRSYEEWKKESLDHGWPSFRDTEVVHDNVRLIGGPWNAEIVSKCGTHLGHNLPDGPLFNNRRDCVNLMCMAGVKAEGITWTDWPDMKPNHTNFYQQGGSGVLPLPPTTITVTSPAVGSFVNSANKPNVSTSSSPLVTPRSTNTAASLGTEGVPFMLALIAAVASVLRGQ